MPEQSLEVSVQVRLVVEADLDGRVRGPPPVEQQPPGPVEATAGEVLVRRDAVLLPERPHQVRRVRAEQRRCLGQADALLTPVRPGAPATAGPARGHGVPPPLARPGAGGPRAAPAPAPGGSPPPTRPRGVRATRAARTPGPAAAGRRCRGGPPPARPGRRRPGPPPGRPPACGSRAASTERPSCGTCGGSRVTRLRSAPCSWCSSSNATTPVSTMSSVQVSWVCSG